MGMRRLWIVLLLAAGCSSSRAISDPPLPSVRAETQCRAASPHTFVKGTPTTVGAIHAITGGRRTAHPWTNLYAGARPDSFAAWCWRHDGGGYQSYVVGPAHPIFLNVRTDTAPPDGPLAVA